MTDSTGPTNSIMTLEASPFYMIMDTIQKFEVSMRDV